MEEDKYSVYSFFLCFRYLNIFVFVYFYFIQFMFKKHTWKHICHDLNMKKAKMEGNIYGRVRLMNV